MSDEGDRRIENLEKMVKEIHDYMFVQTNGTPPFTVRVDRLEQTQGSQRKNFWILYGAIACGLCFALFEWLFRSK